MRAGRFHWIALGIFILTLLVTVVFQIKNSGMPYTYRHGSISTVFATEGRAFAQLGFLHLGGVPVNNNSPIGEDDYYVHWPPLLPSILGVCFRGFGVSEGVGHLCMLAVEIATALFVFAIGKEWLGSLGAALAGFFWLTMPVVVHYGHVVVPENLAILLMLVAVWAFLRLRGTLAAVAVFLAVIASWEGGLLVVGLWAAALVTRHAKHRRIATLCTIASVAGLLVIAGMYVRRSPALVSDAIQTARFRMGLTHAYSHRLVVNSVERYVGLEEAISRMCVNFPRMLGLLGAGALAMLILVRPKDSTVVLCTLGIPWGLWCVFMRNHMAVHDIEMQLAAPLASLALAWLVMDFIEKRVALGRNEAIVGGVLLGFFAIQPWLLGTEDAVEDPRQIIGFSAGIRENTDRGAIVFSPLVSPIPVYYSERHLIRFVADRVAMERMLPYVRREYPGAPLYWATPLYSPPWVVLTAVH